jgi:PAS domain S-box-containing protein
MDAPPIRVLVIEDNHRHAQLLRDSLASVPVGRFELSVCTRLQEGVEVLSGRPFDVVLLDLLLPDSQGVPTFTAIRNHVPAMPVVVLTGVEDEALGLEAVRHGAQDYLVKGQMDSRMLARVIRYAIERKRVEEQLREREEFFRLISENVTDLIAVVDPHGRRLYNSPSYRNLLGDPDRLHGTDSFGEVHPEDQARIKELFRQTVQTAVGQRAEYRFVTQRGDIRYIESQGSVIRDAAGRLEKVVVVSRDITERKQAEIALRESEQRYKRLLSSTTDYIFTVTVNEGRALATEHGPGCEAVTGYTSADYANDPYLWLRMVHEEDRAAVLQQAAQVLEGQNVAPLEHRIWHKDGTLRWVKNTPVPHFDGSGKLVSYDGLITNITDRKRMEEERDRFFTLSLDMLCIAGFDGYYKHLNPAWESTLGYAKAELMAEPYLSFVHPEDRDATLAYNRSLIHGERVLAFENRYRCKDGSYKWLLWSACPFPEQQLIYATARDITERKRSEAELKRANTELARSEEALRKALTDLQKSHEELKAAQLQLIQAEKMESVGTLAAGVAHEVKNPLQTILMGLEYLASQTSNADPTGMRVLADMREAINRADSIVRGLLGFSAAQQLDLKEEDINSVVENALWLVSYELNRRPIAVVRQLGTNLPSVRLDRQKISQALINLFLNAVYAMPTGGTLLVRTFSRELTELSGHFLDRSGTTFQVGGRVVVVEIEDSGTGIPEDKLVRIFDPFFTTKPVGEGTGLGLTVVQRIVELHHAMISIRNRPEGGVKATITFKAEQKQA